MEARKMEQRGKEVRRVNKVVFWAAMGAAGCLLAAAVLIGRASRRDVDDIDRMLRFYD